MVHQPPDPFVSPRGVVAYVQCIVEAGAGLPIVLYLRNENIGLDAVEALCRIPEVFGIKWASPTPLVLAAAMRRTADRQLAWVGGLAKVWAPPFRAVGHAPPPRASSMCCPSVRWRSITRWRPPTSRWPCA